MCYDQLRSETFYDKHERLLKVQEPQYNTVGSWVDTAVNNARLAIISQLIFLGLRLSIKEITKYGKHLVMDIYYQKVRIGTVAISYNQFAPGNALIQYVNAMDGRIVTNLEYIDHYHISQVLVKDYFRSFFIKPAIIIWMFKRMLPTNRHSSDCPIAKLPIDVVLYLLRYIPGF